MSKKNGDGTIIQKLFSAMSQAKNTRSVEAISNATIKAVLDKLSSEQVDALAAGPGGTPDNPDSAEFQQIGAAVMAWWTLFFASGVVKRRDENVMETIASSALILGTLVKYAYALGRRQASGAKQKHKK